MAITNHERVGKMLELLRSGLGPFIERELKNSYQDNWLDKARRTLRDSQLQIPGTAENLSGMLL